MFLKIENATNATGIQTLCKYERRHKIFKAQSQPSPQGFASQGYHSKWLSNRTGSAGSRADLSLSVLNTLFHISSWENESGEEPELSLQNDVSTVPTPARAPVLQPAWITHCASRSPWEPVLQARCPCLNCLRPRFSWWTLACPKAGGHREVLVLSI